jgi:lysyl-tRNA synthetase class 1
MSKESKLHHWADEAAAKIIRDKGEKNLYTCASGITPSGTVHIGNFREIITVELVARALREMGKNVRFIYSWDDYDVFRKIPKNMPNQDELEKFLRYPITLVPDPWERDANYARHHEVDIENILPKVGIMPEYIYQSERYRASQYALGIKLALEHREKLKNILDKFRDDEHKIHGEWWPISVFCNKCSRDNTEIDSWNNEWDLGYHCKTCANTETVDIRKTSAVKLAWRIDWPMRWEFEKVDFEPAGKDHHSQGGSFDTARHISREVYNHDAPVTFQYDFIGTKGLPGKMSSSMGNVITIDDVLKIYTPEIARYLFAGTRPNVEFTISFDLDVIKIYEDYDKTERIACKMEPAKDEETYLWERRIYELSQVAILPNKTNLTPFQIPFRHYCNLIQIADGDIEKTITALGEPPSGPAPEQIPALRARAECAKYWVENCAPEEYRFRLRASGEKTEFSANECQALRLLRDDVINCIETYDSDKTCAEAIYAITEKCNIDSKALFRISYQALINKNQGPRLASFLRTIEKERLMGILSAY